MEYIHTSHYQVSHSPFRACYWHTHESCNVVLVKSTRVISVIVGSTIEFPSVRLASSITVTEHMKKTKKTLALWELLLILQPVNLVWFNSVTIWWSWMLPTNLFGILDSVFIYICVCICLHIYISQNSTFSPLFAVPCKNTTNFNFQLQTWWLCLKHRRGPLWHHHRMKCFPLCFKHWWSDFSQCVISNLGNLVCVFFFPCNNYIPVSDKTYYFF